MGGAGGRMRLHGTDQARPERAIIEVTAVRLAGGGSHEHIAAVRWRSATTPTGESTVDAIVAWLSASTDNHAVVVDGQEDVAVAVVLPPNAPPYLRACSEGAWTDHLLALPTF